MIGLLGVYCSIQLWQWESFVMFLLTRLLDGIDGAYARATNQCTEFGGYLDIVVDFTVRNRLLYLFRYTALFPLECRWELQKVKSPNG